MTYKKLKNEIQALLEDHAMIKQVRFSSPLEWLYKDQKPEFPLCCFTLDTGNFEAGYINHDLKIWFLDQAGQEGEFDTEVISDQMGIAVDVYSWLKQSHLREWITNTASYVVVSEKFDDYLSGIELSLTLKVFQNYDTCIIPIAD